MQNQRCVLVTSQCNANDRIHPAYISLTANLGRGGGGHLKSKGYPAFQCTKCNCMMGRGWTVKAKKFPQISSLQCTNTMIYENTRVVGNDYM